MMNSIAGNIFRYLVGTLVSWQNLGLCVKGPLGYCIIIGRSAPDDASISNSSVFLLLNGFTSSNEIDIAANT